MASWDMAVGKERERERNLRWAENTTPVSLVIRERQIQGM